MCHTVTAGCYVLGLGYRELGPIGDDELRALVTAAVECDLTMAGLLVFRNALKPVCVR